RAGRVEVPVEITDAIMPGVVSVPHGWGHDAPGIALRVASTHAGVNSNLLADELAMDPLSGNAVLNGIPGTVESAGWGATRQGQGDPTLGTQPAVDQHPAPQLRRGLEVPQHLDLDAERVADADRCEDAEVVDRREVARLRGVFPESRQQGAAALGEGLQQERGGESPVPREARVGRRDVLQKRPVAPAAPRP